MNTLLANLASAKSNPHVLWPIIACIVMRAVLAILDIWMPGHVAQVASTKAVIDPIITALISYSTIAAANSNPSNKPANPPANTEPK